MSAALVASQRGASQRPSETLTLTRTGAARTASATPLGFLTYGDVNCERQRSSTEITLHPVLHVAPVNRGMMTVEGVDMNCDGIPDLLQQPQSGLAPQGFAWMVAGETTQNIVTPVQYAATHDDRDTC